MNHYPVHCTPWVLLSAVGEWGVFSFEPGSHAIGQYVNRYTDNCCRGSRLPDPVDVGHQAGWADMMKGSYVNHYTGYILFRFCCPELFEGWVSGKSVNHYTTTAICFLSRLSTSPLQDVSTALSDRPKTESKAATWTTKGRKDGSVCPEVILLSSHIYRWVMQEQVEMFWGSEAGLFNLISWRCRLKITSRLCSV